MNDYHEAFWFILTETHSKKYKRFVRELKVKANSRKLSKRALLLKSRKL